ncbi:hypothetical protein D3C76_1728270 [compost metagenome]
MPVFVCVVYPGVNRVDGLIIHALGFGGVDFFKHIYWEAALPCPARAHGGFTRSGEVVEVEVQNMGLAKDIAQFDDKIWTLR